MREVARLEALHGAVGAKLGFVGVQLSQVPETASKCSRPVVIDVIKHVFGHRQHCQLLGAPVGGRSHEGWSSDSIGW